MVVLLCAACSDWVNISPKTDIEAEKFFSTENGFKSALIGIYAKMTHVETYGANMSFLYIEQLAQRYDNYTNMPTDEERAKIYNYSSETSSKNKIATIWLNMYQTIANINNLLENLDKRGDVIRTEGYRDLIRGEALGLRAFHYFDLLRLWGPVYANDSTAWGVPWRDRFTSEKAPLLRANELIGKILKDLHEADELLRNDPLNYKVNTENPFLGERKHRMNKMAVEALIARVYLYAGDKVQAARYAHKVIDECGLTLVRDNQNDVSLYGETLFALGMDKMKEKLKSYWQDRTVFTKELWISRENFRTIFEYASGIGINDIRYRANYGFIHTPTAAICRKYLGEEGSEYDEKIPLIRLSEMYYILTEAEPLNGCEQYINAVRSARGISLSDKLVFATEDDRYEALEKEYQKDFFAEGQFFYFLKRHNRPTFYRCPVEKMIYYTLPYPDNEVEFGDVTP